MEIEIKDKRQVSLKLIDDATTSQNSYLMKYDCIFYQENLYAKELRLGKSMQIIMKEEFSCDQEMKSAPIAGTPKTGSCWLGRHHNFSEGRWLSPGQMLKRFYDL